MKPPAYIIRGDLAQCMPGTAAQITQRSGYARRTVDVHLANMQADQLAHVHNWIPPEARGHYAAMWYAGPGRNAPYPKRAKTNSQRWHESVRLLGREHHNAQARKRYHLRRAAAGLVDPLQAAAYNIVRPNV